MGEQTGLGLLDVLVLKALEDLGATPGANRVKSSTVVGRLMDTDGIGPRYGYEALCDLARPWLLHACLVDFHANVGRPDFTAADSRYTEARLNRLGALALAAEQGKAPALPIGLINGTVHVDGNRPPLDPGRALAALRAAATDSSDGDLISCLGMLAFPTGCQVTCNLEQLSRGEPTRLTLDASIEPTGPGAAIISKLPPGISNREVVEAIDDASRTPVPGPLQSIRDINDCSTGTTLTEIRVDVDETADLDQVIEQLGQLWGLTRTIDAQLPAPTPQLLRGWIARHGPDGLELLSAAL